MTHQLLFVDDDQAALDAYRRSLGDRRDTWRIATADSPFTAWDMLCAGSCDVVVTDMSMPGLNGLELLDRIKRRGAGGPEVIVVTGVQDQGLKRAALDLGAADLMFKPVDREDLIARLSNALRVKEAEKTLQRRTDLLERQVRARTASLAASRLEIVWRLAKAAEFRDVETGNHVIRVGCYAQIVAEAMGLPTEFVDAILLAAPLHDVGKIGVSDAVLRKPGRLDYLEFREMRRHCEIGAAILGSESRLLHVLRRRCGAFADAAGQVVPGQGSEDAAMEGALQLPLRMAAEIALAHHEQWSGDGYPRGLVGAAIPVAARITAIADVYDAVRSARPYKAAMSREVTLDTIAGGVGTHFDPDVYSAWRNSLDKVFAIEEELADELHGPTREGIS